MGQQQDTPSAATVLVRLAMDRWRFGVSTAGETFAATLPGERRLVFMLRGGTPSLRGQLSRMYWQARGKAAPQQALADALLVLEGAAQEQDPEELHLRVAQPAGVAWLDMGDQTGRAIRINGTGWQIVDKPPVMFKRTPLMGPLPEPVPGADLAELWDWLNVTEADRPLVAAYLVAALRPDIPHPVLNLSGEQGSGKSTAQKVLVSVLDPGPVPNRKPPRDADAWVTAAAGSWVVGLDNLSGVADWLSDSLCRAVTGDADVRRKLYTDGELAVFAYRRVVVLTGIDLGALNGDLADRMLPIHLDLIPDVDRLEEAEMWPGWAKAHPRILGAVLDLAASVAAVLPSVRLGSKPRMADYARTLACVDRVLGTDGLTRYLDKQRSLATESLTADEFITAMETRLAGPFEGTSAELLAEVTPVEEKWRPPKTWPANARVVTQRLRKQGPVMRKARWSVEELPAGHDNAIRWAITRPEIACNPGSQHSQHSHGASDASVASDEYEQSQDDLWDSEEAR